MKPETKKCQNCQKDFIIESEDFNFYEKIKVPSPTFCPECRMQRRMSFRNERSLYKDTCDLCRSSIISQYSADKPFSVYCNQCWNSDRWDPMQYAQDYDFNKPFFVQFRELMEKVPRISLVQLSTNLNCDYANYITDCKNVYLSQSVTDSENAFYSYSVDKCFDVFDCLHIKDCSQCYENIDCAQNNHCKFMFCSRGCINSSFLFDCINCSDCFMSSNLRNKQFMIRNKQYSKEEYFSQMDKTKIDSFSELVSLKKEFISLVQQSIHRFANLVKTTSCIGDNISNAKNVKNSFDITVGEDLKFCVRTLNIKDSYDVTGAVTGELFYEAVVGGHEGSGVRFSSNNDTLRDVEYSDWCKNSSNLFGCVGVKNKEYCILNRQYAKNEYEKLRARIIEHMKKMSYLDAKGSKYLYGEFFPITLSPFAYNESMAEEHMPMTKKETIDLGYSWLDPEPSPYTPTITSKELPDDIKSAPDSITKEIIACPSCDRVYRILQSELEFLRQERIALPRKCQECRHKDRFVFRNPLKLWHRKCMNKGCANEFETSYAPDRPEIVYCEKCYQREIY